MFNYQFIKIPLIKLTKLTTHSTHLGVDGVSEDAPVVGHELHHLLQRRPLHLLPLEVGQGVRDEVEEDGALPDLLDEQLLLLRGARFVHLRQLNQLPVLGYVEPRAALAAILLEVRGPGELHLVDLGGRRSLARVLPAPSGPFSLTTVSLLGRHRALGHLSRFCSSKTSFLITFQVSFRRI